MNSLHFIGIEQVAATVCKLLGIPSHDGAAEPIDQVLSAADTAFGGKRADRIFLYNPDAIGQWIFEKYRADFAPVEEGALVLPMRSVMPSVTPVCFGSMYSGVMPAVHGIQSYVKPVLTVPTLFDDLLQAGKKPAIVSTAGDSISKIFLEREMDYFIYQTIEECNKKALELIREDRHDLIVLYNGNYDTMMHRHGPEGIETLRALRENVATYAELRKAIGAHWGDHRTALVFAPDHGCHLTAEGKGTHGCDDPSDMHIPHFYHFNQST